MKLDPRPAARLAAASLILASALAVTTLAGCRSEPEWNGTVVDPPVPAPELVGVNWNGERFRLSELDDRVRILFFGYTYCPDVCPFTLQRMQQLHQRLGERADDVAVVFVSVDPERDTVEKLSRYVPNFDPDFYGLHLDPEEMRQMQEGYEVTVQYGQPKDGPGSSTYYYVDHTGTIFVVDREGRLRLTYPANAEVDVLLPDVERLLAG